MFRFLLLSLIFFGAAASIGSAADLTIGMSAEVTSIDPHYINIAPNNAIAWHVFDALTHVYEHARMPLREFEWITKYTFPRGMTVRQKAEAGVLPIEYLGEPDDMVRILKSPDIVHIIVCGDPHRNRLMSFEGGHTTPTIREIKLPSNWQSLLGNRGLGRRDG